MSKTGNFLIVSDPQNQKLGQTQDIISALQNVSLATMLSLRCSRHLHTPETLNENWLSSKRHICEGVSHCCRPAVRTSDTQMPRAQSSQYLLGTFMSPHFSLYLPSNTNPGCRPCMKPFQMQLVIIHGYGILMKPMSLSYVNCDADCHKDVMGA